MLEYVICHYPTFLEGIKYGLSYLSGNLSSNITSNLPNFKHLYFTINVLNTECSKDFSQLMTYMPNLESLYIGVNQWGDEGLLAIKNSLKKLSKLERIELGSSGFTDSSLAIIQEIIEARPRLACVELGSYKSTNYFGQKHNRFTNIELINNMAMSLKNRRKVNILEPSANTDVYLGLNMRIMVVILLILGIYFINLESMLIQHSIIILWNEKKRIYI